jgi:plasmid replication initiation protein
MSSKVDNKVLKHDNLVSLGREFEGMKESRFLNCCLVGQNSNNLFNETEYYPVNITRYAKVNGLTYSVAYKEVKDYAVKHMEQTLYIKLPNGSTWGTPLIYDIEFCDINKYLKIKWNKEVIPLISGTMEAGKWCKYDPETDSVPSNKVYLLTELLQKNEYLFYRNPKSFTIQTVDLREATNTLTSYPEYKDLNRKVIQPALKEMKRVFNLDITYKGNKREVTFRRNTDVQ